MFYQRAIFSELIEHAEKKQITVITGMRRTGKTTLVRELLNRSTVQQKRYFDLERIDYRELFSEKNYETIIYALTQQGIDFSQKVLLALDEIQLVANLPSLVKYLYDHYDIKFILTGSSSYYLKNRFNESLAGRKKIFEVYPLTFAELLAFNEVPFQAASAPHSIRFVNAEYERLKSFYEQYLQFGGFPEVVLATQQNDKKDLIADILSSYLNLDIVTLTDFKHSKEVYQLVKLLAVRIGTKLDISKLTSFTSMSRPTVQSYLDLLEESYLIKTIPVLANSPDREIVKARKIYFLDNGIANMAGELSGGAKFENAVFNQLHPRGEVAYYQLKTGKEIDFILDKKIAFEIKETANISDLAQVTHLAKNLNISDAYVIGRVPNQLFEGYIWGGFLG